MGLIDSNLTQKMFTFLYLCCYPTSNLNEPNLPNKHITDKAGQDPHFCALCNLLPHRVCLKDCESGYRLLFPKSCIQPA